jgi:SPP1 gp7 family putative phage head morphogenesis protein
MARNLVSWSRANVVPVIEAERRAFAARDGLTLDGVGANARSIINALRIEAERLSAKADLEARAAIEKDGSRHTRQFIAGVRAQAQIDLSALLRDDDLVDVLSIRSEEANRLIRNLSQDIHDRIERETLGAIFEGRSNADVAKSLQEIDGIGRQRARLIARDQASKLNAAMNEYRQGQAGVTHYKWATILDGRERPSHNANNGKIFPWARAPEKTGHPGHQINCRCRALAVITDDPEEIEKGAVPPDLDPGDLDDFFVANLPAIRSVSAVPRTNIGALTPADIAERLTQAVELQRKVSAATAATLPEATAEKLIVELFGYLPKDTDLAAMLPGTISKLVASRRTILVKAANERLALIERLLRQPPPPAIPAPPLSRGAGPAIPTPGQQPATNAPRQPAAKPMAKKEYPAGRYFEREAGPEMLIEDAETAGEDFTRSQGIKTGHEWGLVHDARGRIIARVSSGKRNAVEFSPSQIPEMYDADASVTFHHNHPSSSTFSPEDVRAFVAARGLDKLFAHGHDGSTYVMRSLDRRLAAVSLDRAQKRAETRMAAFVASGEMTSRDAFFLAHHVRMRVLADLGLVEYRFRPKGDTARMFAEHNERIEQAVARIVRTW